MEVTPLSPPPAQIPLANESLQSWRERLISAVLLGASLLGTPVVIAGLAMPVRRGDYGLASIYVLLYGALLACTFLPRVSYHLRAFTIVSLFYLVGTTEYWNSGLVGDGKLYFFGSIVLAGVLFGLRGSISATAVCMATALIACGRFLYTVPPGQAYLGQVSYHGISWLTSLLSLGFLSATVTISVGYLLRRLEASRDAANSIALRLRNEITEREKAQAELASYQANLETLVAQRTEELRDTQIELRNQESLASLGRLTTTISHELRTPLGTIHSSAFFLGRNLKEIDEATQRALDRIDRNVKRCDHIIEELVHFGKDEVLQKESLFLDDWLLKALEAMDIPDGAGLELKLQAGCAFQADETQLFWCVRNVVTNAVEILAEFGPAHAGENACIRVHSQVEGKNAVVIVEDNGVGISPEDLPHVFEPLFSTKGFGAGLGLAIARKIARIHGGDLEVRSTRAGETRLAISLPLEIVTPPESNPTPAGVSPIAEEPLTSSRN